MRGLRLRLTALDQRLLDQVTVVDSHALDHVLPRLSVAANYGRLWLGVAAVLAVAGGSDGRRAAVRGLASLAVASATANVLAKGATRRVRPHLGRVPAIRLLRRQPVTTSFPSGHSASAAAFATGAVLELPALAAPLGCLAAAVLASRVVTGAHYPSDVAAGGALGVAAALALPGYVASTPRWPACERPWPTSPAPARGRHRRPRPARLLARKSLSLPCRRATPPWLVVAAAGRDQPTTIDETENRYTVTATVPLSGDVTQQQSGSVGLPSVEVFPSQLLYRFLVVVVEPHPTTRTVEDRLLSEPGDLER